MKIPASLFFESTWRNVKCYEKITGSRDNPHIEVLSAPTSPTEQAQTPLKLSANLGRNPLRGSKCKFFMFSSLLPSFHSMVGGFMNFRMDLQSFQSSIFVRNARETSFQLLFLVHTIFHNFSIRFLIISWFEGELRGGVRGLPTHSSPNINFKNFFLLSFSNVWLSITCSRNEKRFRTRIKIHSKSADFLPSRQWLTYEITPRLTLVKKQNNKISFSHFCAFYAFSLRYGSF